MNRSLLGHQKGRVMIKEVVLKSPRRLAFQDKGIDFPMNLGLFRSVDNHKDYRKRTT